MYSPHPFTVPIKQRSHIHKVENGIVHKMTNAELGGIISNKLFIKVLSYNVLADCYSHYFMFKYVDHSILKFKYRSFRILEEIKQSNSDIICLQEVDHIHDFYKPNLEQLGYSIQYTLRREKDAVLVGYKKDYFLLLHQEPVDYNEIMAIYQDKSFLRHNKAQICLLEHIESKLKLIVISSHLFWGEDNIKSAQTSLLIQKLSNFIEVHFKEDQELPGIIICGDFNSGLKSPTVRMIYGEQLDMEAIHPKELALYNKINQLYQELTRKKKFKLISSYQKYNIIPEADMHNDLERRLKGHPSFTNYTGKYKDHFDYIFHSENLLEMPTLEDLTMETALPNSIFPSDHVRIEALFSLELNQNHRIVGKL
ncbi:potential mrna deadenylase and ccr4-not complex subunit ccr4p [Stylonychia lemnae]|uniref:Potential mrna deadenylase and ccr4-not complex subunit ccr4p n=1 Tax=Stylonychia lemnae TaxID=5949 RepID=A0A078AEM2_STYLE|nr:potential mrna deadenylase and ccr4-not complex subunit ccr4p [Stylonychia lemnae]|eukprot:CDW80670.1 potential mrna deadenylase and ccr4-not complex subunit ccr4p [Stylonychia lemnae]